MSRARGSVRSCWISAAIALQISGAVPALAVPALSIGENLLDALVQSASRGVVLPNPAVGPAVDEMPAGH